MTMTDDRRSAEIYQFPPRGRFVVARAGDESKSVSGLAPFRVATNAIGGNWYHEDAILDAERARKS